MAVFRVERTKGFTVMSNFHLNDKTISLKAKGLLSQMLSLPDTWDYTLRGLACINKESIDAIRTAVLELEQHGYITRYQFRDSNGKLAKIEYTIFEQPQSPIPTLPCLESPITDTPCLDNPTTVNPNTEKPTQLNTKATRTQKGITELSKTNQSICKLPNNINTTCSDMDRIDAIESYLEIIKSNIEYDFLVERFGAERIDEVVELILETVLSNRGYMRIAGNDYPREVVKSRFLKITSSHIEYVFDCLDRCTAKVHNIKSYLLTALYNAPATMDSFYRAEVNHDFYGV